MKLMPVFNIIADVEKTSSGAGIKGYFTSFQRSRHVRIHQLYYVPRSGHQTFIRSAYIPRFGDQASK